MYKKILVGYDGSEGSKAALAGAAKIAEQFEANVTALWVREPLPRYSDLPGEAEEEFANAEDFFQGRQMEVANFAAQRGLAIECETQSGQPAKGIVAFAKKHACDLIIIGHSNHSGFWSRLLLGDTADRISDHAHCSVLIVKVGLPAAAKA